jgi:hypothetical protein
VDEERRRRRELRVVGGCSAGMLCDEIVGSGSNTAARIEDDGFGKEGSVLVD